MAESEQVFGKNNVYEYVAFDTNDDSIGDSLGVFRYSNFGDMPTFDYSRISIRPKLKLPIGDNFYYQSEYYYKPAGGDVLTNWNNSFTIKTAEEWLSIEIKYNLKTDSRPAPKIFMTYDPRYYTSGQDITFTNPGKGNVTFDRDIDQSIKDGYGNYYITNYKANDSTVSIGIKVSF